MHSEDDEMRYTRSDTPGDRVGWRRWFGVAAVYVTAVLFAGCGVSSPPDPLSASVVEARSDRMEQIGEAGDELVAAFGGQVLGRSSIDECYEGQRNWKVDRGYDYRCSLRGGVLIAIDGNFRARMLDADVALRELGWESSSGEWPGQLVDDYWDLRAGESSDGRVRIDRLPGPYTVMRGELTLGFDYGRVADVGGLDRIDRSQQSTVWCCGPTFYDNRDLIDLVRATRTVQEAHLVFITIESHYFQN